MNKQELFRLQEFRAMQLAIKGSLMSANYHCLCLEGIDRISIGDEIEITEISLDKDIVVISIGCAERYANLSSFSENIIDEVIGTMRCKALEIADKEVMIKANQI